MKRLSMRKIRDALRLQAGGLSTRKIAASLGLGQSTASEYLGRARAAGLGWPLPEGRKRLVWLPCLRPQMSDSVHDR